MLVSDKRINVLGEVGGYTRKLKQVDISTFKEVDIKCNLHNKDLGSYVANRIIRAKSLYTVFENLKKQGFTLTTVMTIYGCSIPCYNTEIGGLFNGELYLVNVLWTPVSDEKYNEKEFCIIKQNKYELIYMCYSR